MMSDKLIHQISTMVHEMSCAIQKAGFKRPNVLVVGDDVQEQLLAAGVRPTFKGSWGWIDGIEIRGVSDRIAEILYGSNQLREDNRCFRPEYLGRVETKPDLPRHSDQFEIDPRNFTPN